MDQSVHLHVSVAHLIDSGWCSIHARVSAVHEPYDPATVEVHWVKNVEAVPDEDHASLARGLFSEAYKVAERLTWARSYF